MGRFIWLVAPAFVLVGGSGASLVAQGGVKSSQAPIANHSRLLLANQSVRRQSKTQKGKVLLRVVQEGPTIRLAPLYAYETPFGPQTIYPRVKSSIDGEIQLMPFYPNKNSVHPLLIGASH